MLTYVYTGFLRSRNYVYESGKFDPEVYIRGPTKAIPTQDVRADAVGHWPQIDSVRQRCKFPKCTGHTSFKWYEDFKMKSESGSLDVNRPVWTQHTCKISLLPVEEPAEPSMALIVA
ncbi:hypothetical protein QQF64_002774 [Cirrhinus molitorella]|uniref:Uncharacterized protein n=1 Tax=Cirrhinus molitorella TaxID=172907 RepID=A0ABR3MR51_9TELE